MAVENLVNKSVKLSYFQYNKEIKTERFIRGTIVSEDTDFIQIEGHVDGKRFTINKQHIIEIVEEGVSND